jgi:lipid-binding SYLF domain-containing protein
MRYALIAVLALIVVQLGMTQALAASREEIDRDVDQALRTLYNTNPLAGDLAKQARAILVFPSIVKAGFIVGAQTGNGALRDGKTTVGYYNITAASYGLQAGIQSFSYVMMFMTESARAYLENSGGFEVGVGPSIVVVDAGMAKSLTTTTAKDDVYAFIYGQEGLMAGLGLQGSKITRINPD